MHDNAPPDASAEQPKRKPHSIPPFPVAQNWREELDALKGLGDDIAVSLWRALRNVQLWNETEPERRKTLFRLPRLGTQEQIGFACARAPQLVEAFGTFTFLLRAPGRISNGQVAEACNLVFKWAEFHSLPLTGVYFAEAAARVDPTDPAFANDAGWMCRKAVAFDRAETWYQRAYGLAVRKRHTDLTVSRTESIRALLGLGALKKDMGDRQSARRYYESAAKRAVSKGRRRQAGVAEHYLLGLAAEAGELDAGVEHAGRALDFYPLQDERIPYLAHDFSYLLMRQNRYSLALPLLDTLANAFPRPEDQVLVYSNLAWAAAGVRLRSKFEEAERKVLTLVTLFEEYAPAALIHLSEGARLLTDWDRAEQHAAMAVEAARQRQDPVYLAKALELLDKIASRQLSPGEPAGEPPSRSRMILRRMLARVRQWKAPGAPEPEAIQ